MNAPKRRRGQSREAVSGQAVRDRRQQPQIDNLSGEHQQTIRKRIESETSRKRSKRTSARLGDETSLARGAEKTLPRTPCQETPPAEEGKNRLRRTSTTNRDGRATRKEQPEKPSRERHRAVAGGTLLVPRSLEGNRYRDNAKFAQVRSGRRQRFVQLKGRLNCFAR